MRSVAALLGCAVLAVGLAAELRADSGSFEFAIASDSKEDLSGKSTFPSDASKIYIVYKVYVAKAVPVKAVWWAEKVEGMDPNTRINEKTTPLAAGTYMSTFSFKPNRAWPAGSYRVDLYIDDKQEKSVKFKVVK